MSINLLFCGHKLLLIGNDADKSMMKILVTKLDCQFQELWRDLGYPADVFMVGGHRQIGYRRGVNAIRARDRFSLLCSIWDQAAY
jgi:hypothetical protein